MLTNNPVVAMLPAVDLSRARRFYEGKLGLKPMSAGKSGAAYPDVMYQCGGGTRLYIYQRAATKADHTVAGFAVDDIQASVKELKAKGVAFEEYDMPGLKTVGGIATIGANKTAWFKDTEDNILAVIQMGK